MPPVIPLRRRITGCIGPVARGATAHIVKALLWPPSSQSIVITGCDQPRVGRLNSSLTLGSLKTTLRVLNSRQLAFHTMSAGRINPSDGICLWSYIPPSMIDAVLLVWRSGDGGSGWGHRIMYDPSLPAADRYVDFPGRGVQSFTTREILVTTCLDGKNPTNHTKIMRAELTKEDREGWNLELIRRPSCYRGTPRGSTDCWR